MAETAEILSSNKQKVILPKNYMYAKNLEYCKTSEILEDKDELAIIPPVSGGNQ